MSPRATSRASRSPVRNSSTSCRTPSRASGSRPISLSPTATPVRWPRAISVLGTQFKVPLINLSRTSYNLIGLYDKYGWNVRVAYNWRSKFLDSISENGAENLPIYFKSYGSLDASISYQVNEHASITLDGQNLTDSVNKSYQGQPNLLRNYQINDRRVSLRAQVRY
ncbi:TonB-dependent receptor domain-containing protein [Caulobacter segnis]